MTEQTAEIAALFEQCGFEPNSDFQREILDSSQRFVQVTGGEQGGKSVVASKFLLKRWPSDMQKNPNEGTGEGMPILYWLIGHSYAETEKIGRAHV